MNYDGSVILLVTGGRDHPPFKRFHEWLWLDRLCEYLQPLYKVKEVWHGAARGVDTEVEKWAYRRGLIVCQWPAEWDVYGKRAGVMRNAQMLKEAQRQKGSLPILVSFPGGVGTADMTARCEQANLNVFRYPGEVPTHEDIIPF